MLPLLLRLYPSSFRERFEAEIAEYVRMRRAEAAPRGSLAVAWITAALATELAASAFGARARAAAAGHPGVHITAFVCGLFLATGLLGVSLAAFESLIRRPLHLLMTGGRHWYVPVALSAMMVVVDLALAAWYRVVWRRAHPSGRDVDSAPEFD